MKKIFLIILLLMVSSMLINKVFAEVPGLTDDLSGKKYPVEKITVDTGLEKFDVVKITKDDKNTLYSKEKERFVTPDGQWCFVTINIKQEGNEIVKKEELHCADTKFGMTKNEKIEELKKEIEKEKEKTIREIELAKQKVELEKARKPGYWELYASFYYKDLNAPIYCRKYARPDSWFKRPGTVCLNPEGKWEVVR